MKYSLLFIFLSSACLTGCGMADKINQSSYEIDRNTAAIDRSTAAIHHNLVQLEKMRESQ